MGNMHYNDPVLRDQCDRDGRILTTTKRGCYPHTGEGGEVRRFFHQFRSHNIENFNLFMTRSRLTSQF